MLEKGSLPQSLNFSRWEFCISTTYMHSEAIAEVAWDERRIKVEIIVAWNGVVWEYPALHTSTRK